MTIPVPDHIKEDSRRSAKSLYVFPETKDFPIGTLFHARLALIYVLSPTLAPKRSYVARAVQRAYPKYDWAKWWNRERKGKDLPTWNTLMKRSNPHSDEKFPLFAKKAGKKSRLIANVTWDELSNTPRYHL